MKVSLSTKPTGPAGPPPLVLTHHLPLRKRWDNKSGGGNPLNPHAAGVSNGSLWHYVPPAGEGTVKVRTAAFYLIMYLSYMN